MTERGRAEGFPQKEVTKEIVCILTFSILFSCRDSAYTSLLYISFGIEMCECNSLADTLIKYFSRQNGIRMTSQISFQHLTRFFSNLFFFSCCVYGVGLSENPGKAVCIRKEGKSILWRLHHCALSIYVAGKYGQNDKKAHGTHSNISNILVCNEINFGVSVPNFYIFFLRIFSCFPFGFCLLIFFSVG